MAKKDNKKSGKGDKPGKPAKTEPTRAEMPGTVIVNIDAIINMCGSKDHPLAKLLAAH